jgi:hypothetical protein
MMATMLMLSACALPHYIHSDYAQYLTNNRGQTAFPRISAKTYYYLHPQTQNHRKEIRSVMTGYANQWIVEFGPILDYTMQFGDIHQAFVSLEKTDVPLQINDLLLSFRLVDYRFEGFEATVNLKITATHKGTILFEKPYEATGRSQGGKMFWGGAFAMKNAIQQSTKLALDSILTRFMGDLRDQKFSVLMMSSY